MIRRLLFLLFCIGISITPASAQWQRSLLGVFVKGVVSGFGESLGNDLYENTFGMRSNNMYVLHPELAQRFEVIEEKISVLESQVYDINNRVSILDVRLTNLENDMPHGALALGLGLGDVQGHQYQTMNTLASIHFMSASIGLNLNVHTINPPTDFELSREKISLANIIPYARFGSEEDHAFVAFGTINSSAFGYNFLFRNYSNDIIYNDRQFGFKAGVKTPFVGLELMSSSLGENRLKAGRVFVRPFSKIDSEFAGTLTNVGFNYITDLDIQGNTITIQSYDAQVPLLFKVEEAEYHAFINLFGNFATINEKGQGFGLGIAADYKYTDIQIGGGIGIGAWYEYRQLDAQFATGYFNPFYELGRFDQTLSSGELLNPTERTEHSIGLELHLPFGSISGYYVADMDAKASNLNPSNYAHIQASVAIPVGGIDNNILSFIGSASIDQRNIASLKDINISKLMDNDSFDSLFSLSAGVDLPLGEKANIFGKYIYRDFFLLNETNTSLQKIKNSALMVGLQYNWGTDGY